MGNQKHAPAHAETRAQKADNVLAKLVLRTPHGNDARSPIRVPDSDHEKERSIEKDDKGKQRETDADADVKSLRAALLTSLVDFSFVLSLVFGGCCSNVWAYEYLLKIDARIGTALTFSQMMFITLTSVPSFLRLHLYTPTSISALRIPVPSLKPRQVPVSQWALQVLVLTTGSLLNNWAFAFHVPLTIQIVFRSAGLAVSMLFGSLFLKKRYSVSQICSVLMVTIGVILATTSRPMPSPDADTDEADHFAEYTTGVTMLTLSLFLTGALGLMQERTYSKYGPCWREGVFYMHALSLPIFMFFVPHIKTGFVSLAQSAPPVQQTSASLLESLTPYAPYLILAANLGTQLICVFGVNQLTSRVSSVSTNLVLTTRKALSLLFSVWWFGNGWNAQLGFGAGMVFVGSIFYTVATNSVPPAASSASAMANGSPARQKSKITIKSDPDAEREEARLRTPSPKKSKVNGTIRREDVVGVWKKPKQE